MSEATPAPTLRRPEENTLITGADSLVREAACGDASAYLFLKAYYQVTEYYDDLVDLAIVDPLKWDKVPALLNRLYSMPFYVQYAQMLTIPCQLVAMQYTLSLEWEKSEVEWQRRWADTLRFAGMHMLSAVAYICGGSDHMLKITKQMSEVCWAHHHDAAGNPI